MPQKNAKIRYAKSLKARFTSATVVFEPEPRSVIGRRGLVYADAALYMISVQQPAASRKHHQSWPTFGTPDADEHVIAEQDRSDVGRGSYARSVPTTHARSRRPRLLHRARIFDEILP